MTKAKKTRIPLSEWTGLLADSDRDLDLRSQEEIAADREATVRYCLLTDDDDHWYVVPVHRKRDWQAWLDSAAAEDDNVPEWARRVLGSPSLVEFSAPTIGASGIVILTPELRANLHAIDLIVRLRDQLEQSAATLRACKTAVVGAVGGVVEGAPTHEGNYLQRLRELVEKETRLDAMKKARP